jgi:uncharacterized protein (DUF1697 family)
MTSAKTPEKYVAFLRGINVGGKNILPMKDLAEFFRSAGCEQVRTFIQSGNVLFSAEPNAEARLAKQITAAILAKFGFHVPVVLRTLRELEDAVAANPYVAQAADQKALHVYFLQAEPTPEAVAALDPNRSAPDTFVARNREVYLHLPNGMARTKLTNAWFDARLKTVSTARNWQTTLKLLELLKE